MSAEGVASVRAYRQRKAMLLRLQARLRIERRNWRAVWIKTEVPAYAVRELVEELCELADVEEEP